MSVSVAVVVQFIRTCLYNSARLKTYTSVRPIISGLLSLLLPRYVTTANGSDISNNPDKFFKSFPLNDSCKRVVMMMMPL